MIIINPPPRLQRGVNGLSFVTILIQDINFQHELQTQNN